MLRFRIRAKWDLPTICQKNKRFNFEFILHDAAGFGKYLPSVLKEDFQFAFWKISKNIESVFRKAIGTMAQPLPQGSVRGGWGVSPVPFETIFDGGCTALLLLWPVFYARPHSLYKIQDMQKEICYTIIISYSCFASYRRKEEDMSERSQENDHGCLLGTAGEKSI